MNLLKRIWRLEKKWPGIWKLLAAGIAGSFALWQVHLHQCAVAIEHTMKYVNVYEKGSVSTARLAITKILNPYIEQFDSITVGSNDELLNISNSISEENKEMYGYVDVVVDFFDGFYACIQQRICSETYAKEYFASQDLHAFWHDFGPYIQYRRRNNPGYARGMDWFIVQKPTPSKPH